MKFSLNFQTKTIKLERNVNLGDFFSRIEQILPDWKEWKLETNTTINWYSSPIITTPVRPWWEWPSYPTVTYSTEHCLQAATLSGSTSLLEAPKIVNVDLTDVE